MRINIVYDSSVSGAPAAFKTAVAAAVQYFQNTYSAPITVNITVGWGSLNGQALPSGTAGAASAPSGLTFSYNELRNALWRDARTSNATSGALALPAADPTNGGQFFLTSAEAKALGLADATASAVDGYIALDSSTTFTFDPNNRAATGSVDAIGVLENEISKVLGRTSYLGAQQADGTARYGITDLFRYTSAGAIAPATAASKFSVDGQSLGLAFNTGSGDAADWGSSVTGDAFDAGTETGTQLSVSADDQNLLDLLGYHATPTVPVTPTPSVSVTPLTTISTNTTITAGQTVYFTSYNGYVVAGGTLTNSGTIVDIAMGGSPVVGSGGSFTNTAGGVVMAKATLNSAIGIGSSFSNVSNAGFVQAVSESGNAYGASLGPYQKFTNLAGGTLEVYGGTAMGAYYDYGGDFTNAGTVEVTGGSAAGVFGASSFSNSGTIKVTSLSYTPSIGVDINFNYAQSTFSNSGTIIADRAFYADENGRSPPPVLNIKIANSGTVIGDTLLSNGANNIQNTGTMAGDITFGDGNSTYNGAAGRLYGKITLGRATNSVTLGPDPGIVYGGGGNDTIMGGSGDDFFEIPRGTNAINGGGGFNTLSFADAAAGYTVNLGAGTASGAGTTTFSNIQQIIGSSYDDVLIAGATAATLVAGGGHDTLTGGAGNDTLVAGAGGDTMTGGGGNDTFIYSAGDGHLVINDFGTGGDALKIYGYAAANTVTQQGADSLITLSGGDSILFKNVQAGSLSGVTYSASSYAAPLLPASLPVFGTTPIALGSDLTIFAGEHISINGYNAGITTNWATAYSLANFGDVQVTGNSYIQLVGFNDSFNTYNTYFSNGAGATFAVTNLGGDAIGFSGDQASTWTNAGQFSVSGTTSAKGISTSNSSLVVTNAQGATFTVSSATGSAQGVFLYNGGTLVNNGTIAVAGSGAIGISGSGFGYGRSVVNTGTLTATTTGGSPSYGMDLAGGDSSALMPISNSGTITAQIAIRTENFYSPGQHPNLAITNSGTINGDIDIGGRISTITNTGTIAGNILIHDDFVGWGSPVLAGDTIDLRGGTFNGYISITRGAAGDAPVNDVIYSNTGPTVVKIGSGESKLAVSIFNSGSTTIQYDEASSQATVHRNPDGSWTVSAGDFGTETIRETSYGLSQKLQFTDRTISLVDSNLVWQNTSGQVAVWLLNGTTISTASNVGANPGPSWLVKGSGDFDGDGKADILWQNTNGQAGIWFMDGTTLVSGVDTGTNPGPSWHVISAGDFNGDGKADILWQNDSGQAAIWLMNGTTIISGVDTGSNPGPSWHIIGAADFDGDGKSDILWQSTNGQAGIWFMNGTTVLSGVDTGSNPGSSWHVICGADFNGDGKSDILWQSDSGQVGIWLMDGNSVVSAPVVGSNSNPNLKVKAAVDVDGDGKADIVFENATGNAHVWLMNGTMVLSQQNVGVSQGTDWQIANNGFAAPTYRVRGDFNADGKADVVWQSSSGQAGIWLLDGTTVLTAPTVGNNPGPSWHVRGSGDFDGDGKADILWQSDSGQAGIWLMNGTTVLSSPTVGANPGSSWKVIGAGDFDGDGKADILWQSTSGQVGIWFMNGTSVLSAPTVGANPGASWHVIGSGDFNGDGKADILWQSDTGQAGIWLMNGTTILSAPAIGSNPGPTWHVKGAGDFDGDGKSDILWQSDSGQAGIWFMNGTNVLSQTTTGNNPGSAWQVKGAADVNGDGKSDILWQNTNGQAAVWLMNGNTPLSQPLLGANPGSAWHVVAGASG